MSVNKNVLVVAADYGESEAAKGLMQPLLRAGYVVQSLLGEGKKPSPFSIEMIKQEVFLADIVVVLTSDDNVIEVAAAQQAKSSRKQLVFVSLGYRSWEKTAFAEFRDYVSLLIVVNHQEATNATDLYPNASIVASGNPSCESFVFPDRSREQVRGILGLAQEETFVLIAGEKEFNINIPLGVTVLEALRLMPTPEQFRVVFAIHPGHTPLPHHEDLSELIEFYQRELGDYLPNARITVSCKRTPFGVGTPDMAASADVVIGTNSEVQILAAYQSIPVIGLPFVAAWRGVVLHSENIGWWPYYDKGVIFPVYSLSPKDLAGTMSRLLDPTTPEARTMRHRQQHLLQRQPVGTAYQLMVEALSLL